LDSVKRAALIGSVIQVVAKHGFHGASICLIAGGAGVAAGTIYVHFDSKNHLMLETYRELERRCLSAVMKEYPSQGPIRQRFFHLAHGFISHCMVFSTDFLFLDQFLSSPYRESAIPNDLPDSGINSILQLFREGAEKHLFKEMPPAMLFAVACGPLMQVVRANAAGIILLNSDRITQTVEASWEAVSHRKSNIFEGRRPSQTDKCIFNYREQSDWRQK
jgi:TetR/AcrR family transcriptional regulator, repressor of fatR-cypB operon